MQSKSPVESQGWKGVWPGHRGDWEAIRPNPPQTEAWQEPWWGWAPSPHPSSPHTAPLTCDAEPQHCQGCGQTHTGTHTCAGPTTQHLPERQQLTAGLSVVEGCPCL